ncbi:class I SAM-dependent methyltransferase [bacterium]|nr:class I SAM-dependent methyltransferase [Hellea sp.]MDA7807213.1 class I SAM-dependent methyltransferase [bacterium]MDA9047838.1 class I SAM-dependent methyltransferase [Hellea sp.]
MSLFPRQPRFRFFDVMHKGPDWSQSTILDIGGNRGNLLIDGTDKGKFTPSQYTCLDVDAEAIEYGKTQYPDANWVHHDAFNHVYNIKGQDELCYPFEDNTFDIICAYSVYSHTTFKQFIHDLIEILRVCKQGGSVAITLVDVGSAEWFIDKRKVDYDVSRPPVIIEDIQALGPLDYVYYVDNDLLLDEIYSDTKMDYLVTVYNLKWLSLFLQKLNIDSKIKFPCHGHVQRTLVINNNGIDVSKLKQVYESTNILVDILI